MRQPSTKCIPELTNLGGLIVGGLEELGAGLNLRLIEYEEFSAELAQLVSQQNTYLNSYAEMAIRSEALKAVVKEVRSFIRITRDALKPTFGYHYCRSWDAVGLVNTLMIPMTAAKLNPMLQLIRQYLETHPAVPNLDVTFARANELFEALDGAQQSVAAHELAMGTLLEQRNVQAQKMRGLIRLLIAELRNLIGTKDPRWKRFGLNEPGTKERPLPPENIVITRMSESSFAVKWDPAARAQHYRVWLNVPGSDQAPVAIGNPWDPDFTLEELPIDEDMGVSISAVNSGGESARSAVVIVRFVRGEDHRLARETRRSDV